MGKPVLLTVDDDPSVSRAVARDLRRRYGEEYRIMRADSGAQALDALKETRLRGDRVAAILADYRMPQMNGIEFLEEAMDLFPRARRALLTAYADTDAAIQAINVVDVDHYLLKPWDPPEEKLYPVVDSLIATWRATGDAPVEEAKVVGHRFSPQSYEVRDFLARNLVPYRWYGADSAEGIRLLEAAGIDASDPGDAVPLVITTDGEVLRRPTPSDLAGRVGLATIPAESFYDLIVVGGGPAGLGAAVYGASEGLRTVLVEQEATGGQAGQSSRIENYLGFPDGVSGSQLAERARRQAVKFGAEILTTRTATELTVRGPARGVRFEDGSEIAAHAVVLATGVSYRKLEADGIEAMTGRGVYYGAASTEASSCVGEHVVIVGGANSAGQAAVFFSRHAANVTLLVRGTSLAASMSSYLIKQLDELDNVEVRTRTTVFSCHGEDRLRQLCLKNEDSGEIRDVQAAYLFVFIGAAPVTGWLDGKVARDAAGFVLSGTDLLGDEGSRPVGWEEERDPFHLETSVPGVFVAGDVRAQSVKRVASAVGEGAMAVTLVHRYLELR
jgi:thioredoxin reductase (NADPH)